MTDAAPKPPINDRLLLRIRGILHDNSKLLCMLVAAIVVASLVHSAILSPILTLLSRTTPIEYGRNATDLIKGIAWPTVAALMLVMMRKPLAQFLEGVGRRANKLSIFDVELELAAQPRMKPLDVPLLAELKQPVPTAVTTDSAGQLFAQVQQATRADFAPIDLGTGNEWLTSRVFIFAALTERMRGLKNLVFLNSVGAASQRLVGIASCSKVHWSLARHFPYLEVAYLHACRTSCQYLGNPADMPKSQQYIL